MLVNTAANLQDIGTNLAGTYALGKDIDATSIPNFAPIGSVSSRFTGILDGNGGLGLNYTISNLTIAPTAPSATSVSIGMFGSIGATGHVQQPQHHQRQRHREPERDGARPVHRHPRRIEWRDDQQCDGRWNGVGRRDDRRRRGRVGRSERYLRSRLEHGRDHVVERRRERHRRQWREFRRLRQHRRRTGRRQSRHHHELVRERQRERRRLHFRGRAGRGQRSQRHDRHGNVNVSLVSGAIGDVSVSDATGSGAGGLVGFNFGTITNSIAGGAVTGGNSSDINHAGFIGGLVGLQDAGGTINTSFATGDVSCRIEKFSRRSRWLQQRHDHWIGRGRSGLLARQSSLAASSASTGSEPQSPVPLRPAM